MQGERDDMQQLLESAALDGDFEALRFLLQQGNPSSEDVEEAIMFVVLEVGSEDTPRPRDRYRAARELLRFTSSMPDWDPDFLDALVDFVSEDLASLYSVAVRALERMDVLDTDMLSTFYEAAVNDNNLDVVEDIVHEQDPTRSIVTSAEIGAAQSRFGGELPGKIVVGRYYLPALVQRRSDVIDFLQDNNIAPTSSEENVAQMLGIELEQCAQ